MTNEAHRAPKWLARDRESYATTGHHHDHRGGAQHVHRKWYSRKQYVTNARECEHGTVHVHHTSPYAGGLSVRIDYSKLASHRAVAAAPRPAIRSSVTMNHCSRHQRAWRPRQGTYKDGSCTRRVFPHFTFLPRRAFACLPLFSCFPSALFFLSRLPPCRLTSCARVP